MAAYYFSSITKLNIAPSNGQSAAGQHLGATIQISVTAILSFALWCATKLAHRVQSAFTFCGRAWQVWLRGRFATQFQVSAASRTYNQLLLRTKYCVLRHKAKRYVKSGIE